MRSGSSGTMTRSRIRCPAASAIATIKAPEVSVSAVRVSETVITARFSAMRRVRPMLVHGPDHAEISQSPRTRGKHPSLNKWTERESVDCESR